MTEPDRFDVRELAGPDEVGGDVGVGGDAELGRALSAARTLESAVTGVDLRPSPDLADRIMAAVANGPAPRAGGMLAALRRQPGVGGLVESLRIARGRAFEWGGPIRLRVAALSYLAVVILVAVSLSGVAAYTTAGALGWLGSSSHAPVSSPLLPTLEPVLSPEPAETPSMEPKESPEPSGPEPSDSRAGASNEPGDGGGGGSEGSSVPGATEDTGGDGAPVGPGSDSQTPRPGETQRPSGAPPPTSSD